MALSDPLGITAQPVGVLERRGWSRDLTALRALIDEHGVHTVVVGLPLHMSGASGERADRARGFADRLREALTGLRVELWDERLTTVEAERIMTAGNLRRKRRKQLVDALSATIILGSYMQARTTPTSRGESEG